MLQASSPLIFSLFTQLYLTSNWKTGSLVLSETPSFSEMVTVDTVGFRAINNPEFENYLGQMYPAELEIKVATGSTTSATYLDLLLSVGRDGQLHTFIYDKRDDFSFHITNFPFKILYAVTWC